MYASCMHQHMYVQPIPLGVTFSKAQNSKLERLFCHVSVKRDVRALSFELWNSIRKCHPTWDWVYEQETWCKWRVSTSTYTCIMLIDIYASTYVCIYMSQQVTGYTWHVSTYISIILIQVTGICWYGMAMISRLLKVIGLFCRISSLLYGSFAKETYHFEEPTSRSHPIHIYVSTWISDLIHGTCIYIYICRVDGYICWYMSRVSPHRTITYEHAHMIYTHIIHTYMYTYIHTYIHTCIHTYIHAYIHTYKDTDIHA